MTRTGLRIRLLRVQVDEIRLIIAELKSTPPANVVELLTACREAQDTIKAEAVAVAIGSRRSTLPRSE